MGFGSVWWIVVVATVAVWLVSAIVWMVLPHHRSDFKKLPDEDGVMDALAHYLSALSPDEASKLVPPTAHVLMQAFPVLSRVNAIAKMRPSAMAFVSWS